MMITEKKLNDWGLAADLDTTTRIYREHGIARHWSDYSIPNATNLDEAWDQDRYYEDFDKWWVNLPLQEKYRIYHQLTGNE